MAKQYSPAAMDKGWYSWCEKSGCFEADTKSSKPPFVIFCRLRMSSSRFMLAMVLLLLLRTLDMLAKNVRLQCLVGAWMDHAGIATQVVVEKKLMPECNLTRYDIGREEFVSEVSSNCYIVLESMIIVLLKGFQIHS
uniref:valine--tRNA ligase-like isoform X1 n=1 Tax=Fragaria vesca subsp. vesca TaxID=101020 RepID=UPI0005C98D32|nr:PREDICTED: valine--tRNA ligase-like isoform X1 [Fragaria vesca subsp. vesca]